MVENPDSGTARRAALPGPDDDVPTKSSAPRRIAEVPGASRRKGVGFGRTLIWTVLGTIIPGVGLLRSGRRVFGGIALVLFLAVVGGLIGFFYFDRSGFLALAVQSRVQVGVAIALLVIGVLWVFVIGATHLSLRGSHSTTLQRFAGAFVVSVLSLVIVAPMALGANLMYTTSSLVGKVVKEYSPDDSATVTELPVVDPWADKPRLNVLLLGGDQDEGRSDSLGIRTDTVILASIDTKTGATTLFQLPRQTARMPFPKDSPLRKHFPKGFYDGKSGVNAEYFLNAMVRNLPRQVPKDVLGKTKQLGYDALKLSVGEALGLPVDYYVMVDMDGFKDFINAIGGVTINVNYRVPIGGSKDRGIKPRDYLEIGPDQHLSGARALWYARGRYGLDDYSRMERQRCVINAVVQQAQPVTILARYQAIAAAGEKSVSTDIPQSALPALIELADRVQGTTLRSIVFETGKNGFVAANPDFAKIRKRVKDALSETAQTNTPLTPSASPSTSVTGLPTTGTSGSPSASASAKASASPKITIKSGSANLDDACAYKPK